MISSLMNDNVNENSKFDYPASVYMIDIWKAFDGFINHNLFSIHNHPLISLQLNFIADEWMSV